MLIVKNVFKNGIKKVLDSGEANRSIEISVSSHTGLLKNAPNCLHRRK